MLAQVDRSQTLPVVKHIHLLDSLRCSVTLVPLLPLVSVGSRVEGVSVLRDLVEDVPVIQDVRLPLHKKRTHVYSRTHKKKNRFAHYC